MTPSAGEGEKTNRSNRSFPDERVLGLGCNANG
jgi:hypothetical protein